MKVLTMLLAMLFSVQICFAGEAEDRAREKERLLAALHELQESETHKTNGGVGVRDVIQYIGVGAVGLGGIMIGGGFLAHSLTSGTEAAVSGSQTLFHGLFFGTPTALTGGLILAACVALCPSKSQAATVSDYLAKPEGLELLVKLSDEEALAMMDANPKIKQNLLQSEKALHELVEKKSAVLGSREVKRSLAMDNENLSEQNSAIAQ